VVPITPLIRRRVWAAVGGFDDHLPALMDLDFWISAFEYGFRGRTIEEPLLRPRTRPDSLHYSTFSPGGAPHLLETILRKHRRTIEQIGPAFLLAKEALNAEQKRENIRLEQQLASLRKELEVLNDQIGEARRPVRGADTSSVDFGDFRRLSPISPFWGLDR